MKNVTIALDDEIHRLARIRAAELGTSLSALVKDYLIGLAGGDITRPPTPSSVGVRDVQMPFHHDIAPALAPAAKGPDGQPYFVGGQWVWTRNGKARKPGALHNMWVAEDFDAWPEDILASFEAWPHDDPDYDGLPFDMDSLPKQ